jgi:hypothetical protein
VTVQQLIAGVSINIFAGTYNITYTTTDGDNSKVNIKINMPNTVVNGTPIHMNATYNNYLLVIDMVNVKSVEWGNCFGDSQPPNFIFYNGFYYAYCNAPQPYEVWITYTDNSTKKFTLAGKICGNVYWYTSPIGATTELTFPVWVVNKIVL